MKSTITILIVFFFFSIANAQSNSPSVINSNGGTFRSGYFQFEWSVGELSLINQMNSSDSKYVLTNGFIQPYVLKVSYNNGIALFDNDEIKIFPNPASDFAEINFFTKQKGKIAIDMIDASGKSVWKRELVSYGLDLIERIPLLKFSEGSYVIKITLNASSGSISKHGAFKIIKINK